MKKTEGNSIGCELSLWPNRYSPFGNYTMVGYDLGWFSFGERNEIYADAQLCFYYFEREMILTGISLGVVHDYSSDYTGIQGQVWINYFNFGIGGPKIYKPETVNNSTFLRNKLCNNYLKSLNLL